MENAEEVLQCLDEFTKVKPKDIPRELEDYLCFVAKTGDPVYQWSLIKCLFREKLIKVITEFYEACPSVEIPPCPNVEPFNYDVMKNFILEKLETFVAAPFTVQRICELLTTPRKEYKRIDKYMRALEKNILVVSTREPGQQRRLTENDSILNGLENETHQTINEAASSEVHIEVDMEETPEWTKTNEVDEANIYEIAKPVYSEIESKDSNPKDEKPVSEISFNSHEIDFNSRSETTIDEKTAHIDTSSNIVDSTISSTDLSTPSEFTSIQNNDLVQNSFNDSIEKSAATDDKNKSSSSENSQPDTENHYSDQTILTDTLEEVNTILDHENNKDNSNESENLTATATLNDNEESHILPESISTKINPDTESKISEIENKCNSQIYGSVDVIKEVKSENAVEKTNESINDEQFLESSCFMEREHSVVNSESSSVSSILANDVTNQNLTKDNDKENVFIKDKSKDSNSPESVYSDVKSDDLQTNKNDIEEPTTKKSMEESIQMEVELESSKTTTIEEVESSSMVISESQDSEDVLKEIDSVKK